MLSLKPYVEVLANSKEQNEADLAATRANETQKKLELKIATMDTQVVTLENAINTMSRAYPLNIDGLTTKMDELALLQRSRDQVASVVKALFPEGTVK